MPHDITTVSWPRPMTVPLSADHTPWRCQFRPLVAPMQLCDGLSIWMCAQKQCMANWTSLSLLLRGWEVGGCNSPHFPRTLLNSPDISRICPLFPVCAAAPLVWATVTARRDSNRAPWIVLPFSVVLSSQSHPSKMHFCSCGSLLTIPEWHLFPLKKSANSMHGIKALLVAVYLHLPSFPPNLPHLSRLQAWVLQSFRVWFSGSPSPSALPSPPCTC